MFSSRLAVRAGAAGGALAHPPARASRTTTSGVVRAREMVDFPVTG
jgi:hypothetical protein